MIRIRIYMYPKSLIKVFAFSKLLKEISSAQLTYQSSAKNHIHIYCMQNIYKKSHKSREIITEGLLVVVDFLLR